MLLALLMAVGMLAGCAKQNDDDTDDTNDKLRIVTTIFPEYDWVKAVLGDQAEHADITMLLDNGVDLHSYQPTADDIVKISDCDLFLYVGGESEGWVEDALKNSANKECQAVRARFGRLQAHQPHQGEGRSRRRSGRSVRAGLRR